MRIATTTEPELVGHWLGRSILEANELLGVEWAYCLSNLVDFVNESLAFLIDLEDDVHWGNVLF